MAEQITRLESHMIDPRDFGRMEGELAACKAEIAALKAQAARTEDKVDAVLDKLSEAKGGWKALMLLGGAGATLGSLITWAASNTLTIGPK